MIKIIFYNLRSKTRVKQKVNKLTNFYKLVNEDWWSDLFHYDHYSIGVFIWVNEHNEICGAKFQDEYSYGQIMKNLKKFVGDYYIIKDELSIE